MSRLYQIDVGYNLKLIFVLNQNDETEHPFLIFRIEFILEI